MKCFRFLLLVLSFILLLPLAACDDSDPTPTAITVILPVDVLGEDTTATSLPESYNPDCSTFPPGEYLQKFLELNETGEFSVDSINVNDLPIQLALWDMTPKTVGDADTVNGDSLDWRLEQVFSFMEGSPIVTVSEAYSWFEQHADIIVLSFQPELFADAPHNDALVQILPFEGELKIWIILNPSLWVDSSPNTLSYLMIRMAHEVGHASVFYEIAQQKVDSGVAENLENALLQIQTELGTPSWATQDFIACSEMASYFIDVASYKYMSSLGHVSEYSDNLNTLFVSAGEDPFSVAWFTTLRDSGLISVVITQDQFQDYP